MGKKNHRVFILIGFLWTCCLWAETQEQVLKKFFEIENRPSTKMGLTDAERRFVFRFVYEHPVASPEHIGDYEPFPDDPAKQVGYCFGRAMAVHLESKALKLKTESIRKLFIIGDLRSGDEPEWGFHVTTLVRDLEDEKKWFAIDPIMKGITQGRSQSADDWIAVVRSIWDRKKEAKLYITSIFAVMPDPRRIDNPIFNSKKFLPETEPG